MSEQHSNLIPMTRTEVYTALNMSRTTFWREIQYLEIPKGKIVPNDLIRICTHLRRSEKCLTDYIKKYRLKHSETV